jgi:hypothetical protein
VGKLVYGARCFELAIGARCAHETHAGRLTMIKLLTNMTQIEPTVFTGRDDCMSYAGPVDRETAASVDVALWTDAEISAAVESAASARRRGHTRDRHVA